LQKAEKVRGGKMRYFIILSFLIFISFSIHSQDAMSEAWKLKKSKNGIEVFTRTMEGSKFKEYKTVCEINASPQELIDILIDVEHYQVWMAYVKNAEQLEKKGENEFYVYSEVIVPWPFNNRDGITKSIVKRNMATGIDSVEIIMIPDFIPEKEGIVRMPCGRGLWIFTPLDDGKTKVHHQFGGDPGGNIPAWVVNMFLVDGPYKTMLGLQEVVSKR